MIAAIRVVDFLQAKGTAMAYCFARIADGSPSIESVLKTRETARLSGDGSGQVIDTGMVNPAISKAESIVNGYCSKLYAVPFTSAPDLVKEITRDLAIYYLYEAREAIPDAIQKRYDNAMAMLKDISVDKVRLSVDPVTADPVAAPATAFAGKARIFGRES